MLCGPVSKRGWPLTTGGRTVKRLSRMGLLTGWARLGELFLGPWVQTVAHCLSGTPQTEGLLHQDWESTSLSSLYVFRLGTRLALTVWWITAYSDL